MIRPRLDPEVSRRLVDLLPHEDSRALARAVEPALGAPVGMIGTASTLGGMFGPAEQSQAAVDAVLAGR